MKAIFPTNQTDLNSMRKVGEFIEYLFLFYGENGTYPLQKKDGSFLTFKDAYEATLMRLHTSKIQFDGDTFDREETCHILTNTESLFGYIFP